MATPPQLAESMEREFWDFTRVLKFYRDQFDERIGNPDWIGTNPPTGNPYATQLTAEYVTLKFYTDLYIDQMRIVWQGCRRWADRYVGIPDTRFDAPLADATPARLVCMMATNNLLTQTQYESGFTNESFTAVGGDFTRWDAFYQTIDKLVEQSLLLRGRAQWYSDEWSAQGTGDRATEAIGLMEELVGASAFARSLIADEAVRIKDFKGDADVPTNRLRKFYTRRRVTIPGGIYLLNQGSAPAGGPVPDEYDPDLNATSEPGLEALGLEPPDA